MLQRFRAKLEWPLPDGLTDTALEAELYGVAATRGGQRDRPEPDWAAVNRELKRKHVTLQVLWDEHIEVQPDGYRYSRFCELYRAWEGRLPVTMRGRKSTIVASQLPTALWHHAIGDSTYADAILDRIFHNAHRVELEGDSLGRIKASISD